jgi:hypothetical protein
MPRLLVASGQRLYSLVAEFGRDPVTFSVAPSRLTIDSRGYRACHGREAALVSGERLSWKLNSWPDHSVVTDRAG